MITCKKCYCVDIYLSIWTRDDKLILYNILKCFKNIYQFKRYDIQRE